MGRRLGNVVTNALFSDITRKLGPLIAQTSFAVEAREASRIVGLPFQTAILRKPGLD